MDERRFIFQIGQRLKKNCIFVWSEEEYANYINDTEKVCDNIVCLMNANFEIIKMSCVDEDMVSGEVENETENETIENAETNSEEGSNA